MYLSLKPYHNWFPQNCRMDETYSCMFGMTVLKLILPQFLKLSYKLRIHRNKIIKASTLSLYQQKDYFDFLTTAFSLQKQQQSLTLH
jgi:hypothetical protein